MPSREPLENERTESPAPEAWELDRESWNVPRPAPPSFGVLGGLMSFEWPSGVHASSSTVSKPPAAE